MVATISTGERRPLSAAWLGQRGAGIRSMLALPRGFRGRNDGKREYGRLSKTRCLGPGAWDRVSGAAALRRVDGPGFPDGPAPPFGGHGLGPRPAFRGAR